jgi:hypothetical protein
LLAVDGEVREQPVSVILDREFCSGGFEMCEVIGCPPVVKAGNLVGPAGQQTTLKDSRDKVAASSLPWN